MTTTELLKLFRAEVFDVETPYLWSDALVYTYIDDAQKQFCRDTYGIADARSFTLEVVPGVEWYDIDPRILKLRDIVDATTGRSLPVVAVEKMSTPNMRFDGTLGPVRALVSGLEKNTLRAWPKPNVAATLNLLTFRLPSDVAAGDEFEIDPQHVLPLLYWVKHKAYDVQDSETYNKGASEQYRAKHTAYCAKALIEQSRAMHPVGVVTYGGI